MHDVARLLTAVDQLAGRLRSLPQSRLRGQAADEGLTLARELSDQAQRYEFPQARPRPVPDDGIFAVADQLAVAGHDLAAVEDLPAGLLTAAVARIEAVRARVLP